MDGIGGTGSRRTGGTGSIIGMAGSPDVRPPASVSLVPVETPHPESRTEIADYLDETRRTIARLTALDGVHGSAAIGPLALRCFQRARRLLRDGRCAPGSIRDLRATAAELGELTGWLLFDAERHVEARAVNLEAFALARHAGDTAMQWFIRTNQALASLHLGRGREALRLSTAGDRTRLPGRVRALFDVRAARALASLGDDTAARRRFDRARHEVSGGTSRRDPVWSWWFDERELAGHEGMLHADLGDHDRALTCLTKAVELADGHEELRWALYVHRANLLQASLAAGAWSDAENVAAAVLGMIGDVDSARTEGILRRVTSFPRRPPGLPSTLDDLLERIARELPAGHPADDGTARRPTVTVMHGQEGVRIPVL